jgi:DNA-3-methyladenine glycosylase II
MVTNARTTFKCLPPFDFALSAMTFSDGDPQICKYDNGKFWQLIRVDGKPLLATVTSAGTVEEPKLALNLKSNDSIRKSDTEKAQETIRSIFNLDVDLESFYKQARKDGVMAELACKLRGLKSPTTATIFEALINSIVEQQISLSIANKMEKRLTKELGEKLVLLDKETHYAFPTPHELASARIGKLRNCGLSRRKAEFIRNISRMTDRGRLDLEGFKDYKNTEEIAVELDRIPGVGLWTAEMTMIRGMHRLDAFPADDLGLRRVIAHYYRDGKNLTTKEMRKIAERWGTWKGLAGFYLIRADALNIKCASVFPNSLV